MAIIFLCQPIHFEEEPKNFNKSAMDKIANYQWPNNVRQLINSIEAVRLLGLEPLTFRARLR
jgi:DNA-binding NtrC family response regulator